MDDELTQQKLDNLADIFERRRRAGLDAVEQEPNREEQPTVEDWSLVAECEPMDVDWTKYELDERLAHLYPRSQFADGKFVFVVKQFEVIADSNKKIGDVVGRAVNGPGNWEIMSVLPNGSGMTTFVLTRRFPYELPTPTPRVVTTIKDGAQDD